MIASRDVEKRVGISFSLVTSIENINRRGHTEIFGTSAMLLLADFGTDAMLCRQLRRAAKLREHLVPSWRNRHFESA